MKPIEDKYGSWSYPQLPPATRKAVLEDFYNADGRFFTDKAYLVQSHYSNKFECYRTVSRSSFNKLVPWIHDGRVYVFDG